MLSCNTQSLIRSIRFLAFYIIVISSWRLLLSIEGGRGGRKENKVAQLSDSDFFLFFQIFSLILMAFPPYPRIFETAHDFF